MSPFCQWATDKNRSPKFYLHLPVLGCVKRSADSDVAVGRENDDQPYVARLRGGSQRPHVRLHVRPGASYRLRQPVRHLVDRLDRLEQETRHQVGGVRHADGAK